MPKITKSEVHQRQVIIERLDDDDWPDVVKNPEWARGKAVTIRPNRIWFSINLASGDMPRSVYLSGARVRQDGSLGAPQRIEFWNRKGPVPSWVQVLVEVYRS